MGAQDNGLTLQGLARRLEVLERENAELRREVDTLGGSPTGRDEVAALRGSRTRRGEVVALGDSDMSPSGDGKSASKFDGVVSRRALLSKAGAAAVAAVAAGTLLYPRQAKAAVDDFDEITANRLDVYETGIFTQDRSGGNALLARTSSDRNACVFGRNFSSGPGVKGVSDGTSGDGVEGTGGGPNGTGVRGTGRYGVWGESNQAGFYGVTGRNTRTDGTGVRGVGAKRGVLGESTNNIGVEGRGKNGVFGESSTPGQNGVWGKHTNQGAGVSGEGRVGVLGFSHEDGWNAVWGRHTTNGRGVAGDSAQGTGVYGESTRGYGGQFQGGKAQLRLVPGSAAGKPTSGSHAKGELYMDSRATLFVCTVGGTPGTWRRFATAVT